MTPDRRTIALFAPAAVYLAVIVGGTLLVAMYLSTTDARAGSLSGHFVGLGNFARVWRDPTTRRAAQNTAIVAIASQTLAALFGLLLAAGLTVRFRGRSVILFLIVLPWAAPVALSTLGWRWVLDPLYSVLNWALQAVPVVGLHRPLQWLGDPGLALVSIIAVETWRSIPFATVVLLAGFASLPVDVDDAARVDGADGWRKLAYVTVPLLLPFIAVVWLLGVLFVASGMTVVSVLTAGGPFDSTQMTSSWAFQTGILSGDLGPGAAISLLLLPVLAVVSIVVLRIATQVDTRR
jgi:multiple sugar transport system permease protein